METTNKINKELHLNLDDAEANEPEVQEPSIINARTEAPDYKEYIQIETPKGLKIQLGSCCLNVGQLTDICLSMYEHLKKDNGNGTKEGYLG